ncbi:LacI family DNA-binding transcriptional regulator [Sphingomonas nostoxanthinifaciens]|uniref:LacI family DNA-binding transcriptional regulator n=1 Tax=Sphingomonas nostoxanthinifaciens TaxID=2872652 RepID=UPI001CC1CD1E|nr:LacI family DNA-binding transcriptional regulator [Sphingomonas nostoxanthinifaciens]UAK23935.1 LacI family DNA-binding transcriptional regulator [Sphingomonas nostoxanthinifaciens]
MKKHYVSAREVAERAGVSRSAVSRALTPGASISADMKARVIAAADELGYEINMLARGLLDDRSMIVSLVSASLGSPFMGMMLPAITERLIAAGYAPLLINIGTAPDIAEESLRQVVSLRSAAVVILSGSPPGTFIEATKRTGIPLIALNRDEPGLNLISADNRAAGRVAYRELAETSARICAVSPARDTFSMRARIEGFLSGAAEAGHAPPRIIRAAPPIADSGRADYAGGLALGPELIGPDGIADGLFCLNDHIAFGVIDAARRSRRAEAGRDFSVIGFDDVPMAAWEGYRLTTFRQDPHVFAEQIMSTIARCVDGEEEDVIDHLIPANLIARESVRHVG